MAGIELAPLKMPQIERGADIAKLLSREDLRDGDVVILTSKMVSKALGLVYRLDDYRPSPRAERIASRYGLDPRAVEAVLRHSERIVGVIPVKRLFEEGVFDIERHAPDPEAAREAIERVPALMVTIRGGQLYTDAGLDFSNHPPGYFSLPPLDPDAEAKRISHRIEEETGRRVAIVITDTELSPFGSVELARGSYGVRPVRRSFGLPDLYGRPKFGGAEATAQMLAMAAGLLMGQAAEGVPAVLVRGLSYEWSEEGVGRYMRGLVEERHALPVILRETLWLKGASWAAPLLEAALEKIL